MHRRTIWSLAAALCLCAAAAPAQAGFQTYTNRTAFNNATLNQNSFNFSGIAALNGFTFIGPPGSLTRQGVNFSSGGGNLFVIGRDFNPPTFAFTGTDFVLQNNATNSVTNILLPAGTRAFGFDIGIQAGGPATVTFTMSTGEVATFIAPARPGLSFFGVVNDSAITSVTMRSAAFGPSLANFTSASAAPEPASLVLLATGGLGLVAYRRLRRKPA